MQSLYTKLVHAHAKYQEAKLSMQRQHYSDIVATCTKIEQELDAIPLYNIVDLEEQQRQRQLRRLMLDRLGELERKCKKRYDALK